MADNADTSVKTQCVLHELEVLPLVCSKCKVSVCSECLVHEHYRHPLDKVANVAHDYRMLLERELTEGEVENLNIFSEKVQSYSMDLQSHGEHVLCSIKESADALVQRVREHEQIESEKARSLLKKYAQGLDQVQQRTKQCLKYKQASMDSPLSDAESWSDLDIVALYTSFKHLKDMQLTIAKGTQYPSVNNPFSLEHFETDCRFVKVVEENECMSDFDKDEDEKHDYTEEFFYDCEGIPYCIHGEQVIDNRIEEIVPVTLLVQSGYHRRLSFASFSQ